MKLVTGDEELVPESALHRAARVGDDAAIRALCDEGANLEAISDVHFESAQDAIRATPLMVAAGSEEGATVETVRLLLELGADPLHLVNNISAALFACPGLYWLDPPEGDEERLRLLLRAGSPMDFTTKAGNRGLCEIAKRGDVETLRMMLHCGALPHGYFDPEEARTDAKEAFGFMPDADELAAVVERNVPAPSSFEIPVICAAESGSIECVQELIERGADIQVRDDCCQNALWVAETKEMVELLIANGLHFSDRDNLDWSPLLGAVSDGIEGVERMRSLVAAGADVNETHDHGYTAFMSAAGSLERDREVLKCLIELGADPHAVSDYGHNAYHAAVDAGGEALEESCIRSVLGYLHELGVNIEQRTAYDATPLGWALLEGIGLEAQVLVELGADVNALGPRQIWVDGKGLTPVNGPLIYAAISAFYDPLEKAKAMVRANVRLDVVNEKGHSPLEFAEAILADAKSEKCGDLHAEESIDMQCCIKLLKDASRPRS